MSISALFEPWKIDQRVFHFNRRKILTVHVDPKNKSFLFWFFISCYGPVITSVTGPIANTLSIASIVNKWRQTPDGKEVVDSKGVYIINIISLIIGCVSNVVLFMHFSNRLPYVTSQVLNILGWSIASILLIADLLYCWMSELRNSSNEKGIGFWYAFFTIVLYTMCTFTLSVHFLGFKLNKYTPKFNLSKKERAVMMYTLWLSVWFMWGAGMFSRLMDISYGTAIYFCVVSTTTVGLGDITPKTVAAKIMTLVVFFSGLIILGLIVAMTRIIVQQSFRPIVSLHSSERRRYLLLRQTADDSLDHNYKDIQQFHEMRKIQLKCEKSSRRAGAVLSIVIFILFWLFGALIFMFTENWSYFNALYFCFLCLITIGYGDYTPKTNAGKTFFVVWALAAVPMMTVLINSVGDFLFDLGWSLIGDINSIFWKAYVEVDLMFRRVFRIFFNNIQLALTSTWDTNAYNNDSSEVDSQAGNGLEEEITATTSQKISSDVLSISNTALDIPHKMDQLWTLAKDYSLLAEIEPNHKLSYEEWLSIFCLLPDVQFKALSTRNFWLSDVSPIRYITNEPRFAFLQLSASLRLEMNVLLKQDNPVPLGILNRRLSSDSS